MKEGCEVTGETSKHTKKLSIWLCKKRLSNILYIKNKLYAVLTYIFFKFLFKCILLQSVYEPGKRHWLKVKKDYLNEGAMADTADLAVLGAFYGKGANGKQP